jgi:hypothetical protein
MKQPKREILHAPLDMQENSLMKGREKKETTPVFKGSFLRTLHFNISKG